MQRTNGMGLAHVMLLLAAAALVLGRGTAVEAEEAAKAKSKVYRLTDKDYEEFKTGDGSGKLVEYVKQPNMTAGFARFEKGGPGLRNWPYWYEEVVYITKGKGRITVSPPPHTNPEAHEMKVGDFLYIGKGSKVTFEGLSDEPFELLYVTTPNPGL
jgi:ethanolamine utilization protein EutQ (cupin superfamily)